MSEHIHPFLRSLTKRMGWDGDELLRLRESLDRHAPRCVRQRMDRSAMALPFQAEQVPWFEHGWWIPSPAVRPSQCMEFAANDYYIQDAGSMLAVALLRPEPHEWICDVCAAPGGKASAILEHLDKTGWLLANETIRTRLDVLRWNLERTGQPWYGISNLDPFELSYLLESVFDAVLVDAPCSGQVLVASNKRSENAFAKTHIEHSVARQRRILENAIRLLRVGGRLVYSTCTFAIEENEDQIAWLQAQYPSCFEPIESPDLQPWRSPMAAGCFRVWPHRDPTEGAFAGGLRLVAQLPRREHVQKNAATIRHKPSFSKGNVHCDLKILDEFGTTCEPSLIRYPWERTIIERTSFSWDPGRFISKIRWPAFYLPKRTLEVPEHALAVLRPELFRPHAWTELDSQKVLQYLRGETLDLKADQPAWSVATWKSRPLGWLRIGKLRANNGLPQVARHSLQTVMLPNL